MLTRSNKSVWGSQREAEPLQIAPKNQISAATHSEMCKVSMGVASMLLNYYEITISLLLIFAFGVTLYLSLALHFGHGNFVTFPKRMLVASTLYVIGAGCSIHVLPFAPDIHKELIYGIQVAGCVLVLFCLYSWREYFAREVVFVAGLVWSDPERDSEHRRIDEMRSNLSERIIWLIEVYTSSSRCNFNSQESIDSIKHDLLAGEYENALGVLSELLDILILDKISDINDEQLEVLNSFGSVMDNNTMLRTRIGDSQMMEEFLAEKSLALRTLCFDGSFYSFQQVADIISFDAKPDRVEKLSANMADLYLYKKQRMYEPVYKRRD